MAKTQRITSDSGEFLGYAIICPACTEVDDGSLHLFYNKMNDGSPGWVFNGDHEKPTFRPSMLSQNSRTRCHSLVTEGKIQYLVDCTHNMAGQTMDLPDFDEDND